MSLMPSETLIAVADGHRARLFRNTGSDTRPQLREEADLVPQPNYDGPSGHQPPETSTQDIDEATFVKQVSDELYKRAHANDFENLVIVADPRTLGELRRLLHPQVRDKLRLELGKEMTKASVDEIRDAVTRGFEHPH
ncbi:host attachment family protein [Oleiagrimonas sp. C23AA]|uniref:host attachment family protein n=1 Tax=Oleiagrimonas sp. C23AA TaxID=2719047 RepID=UPI001423E6E7|nr:host attachment family protein [Oleiagrimonas sp. C23AA]NII09587.1 host attachment protein [Oleiagrimonas sp. C23AA]